jgi:hypothetical protein
MVGVVSFSVSDPKVIDNENENNVTSRVMPQPGCERARLVPMRFEKSNELVVGKASSLR